MQGQGGKMTNKEASKRYSELATKLADAVNDIADLKGTAEFLAEQCKDNGDPKYLLDEALAKLAPALAMAVSYSRDYAAEEPDKDVLDQD